MDYQTANPQKDEQLALYGMVAGIVSCALCPCGCVVPGACGIAGIVMSSMVIKKFSKQSPQYTKALVGIITGSVGIVLGIIASIISAIIYIQMCC